MDRPRLKSDLSIEDCKKVVDSLVEFCDSNRLQKRVVITGGDPLLADNFWPLIKYLGQKNVLMSVAGNPEVVTEDLVKRLEDENVSCYQLSIDGLEKTHDRHRYPGSFKATMKAISFLSKSIVKAGGLGTVSILNYEEFPRLVKHLFENGLYEWDFARYVNTHGNANIEKIPPLTYRDFLYKMRESYATIHSKPGQIGRKDPLWALIEKMPAGNNPDRAVLGGCGIGTGLFTVLQDGTVMACRRLPTSIIGKVPEQSFDDIFFNSRRLCELRTFESLEKCSNCVYLWQCRGCRAVAFGATGNEFSPDPQCWKEI